jgi:hypothetical protein
MLGNSFDDTAFTGGVPPFNNSFSYCLFFMRGFSSPFLSALDLRPSAFPAPLLLPALTFFFAADFERVLFFAGLVGWLWLFMVCFSAAQAGV